MTTTLYKASERGFANHGWLHSYHSFSFANFYDPNRINFGSLRVLNDDTVAPTKGFGMHRHENMEIISIPLNGSLAHKDNMGNAHTIQTGEIQVMSAGTGIAHSEFNPSNTVHSEFLQIWILPNEQNVTPRYDQQKIQTTPNHLVQILSPNSKDQGVWIHQNAWFHIGDYTEDKLVDYVLKNNSNGVYVFVLEGGMQLDSINVAKRDALAIQETETIQFTVQANSKVLLMEVPMHPH